MKRALYAVLFLISLTAGAYSQAQDESAPAINRRQLSECMMRRMAASRLLSYNDAAKACKDLLQKNHKPETAANVASKPVG